MFSGQAVKEKIRQSDTKEDEFLHLRSLLLGKDYEEILQQRLNESETQRVANVLSEAFHERNEKDGTLASAISPVIESSIDASIKNNPSRITNVIFPIIGPAVRKAVASALSDMIHSLNHMLQQSLTAKALIWRFRAWRLGIPYSQYIILQNIQYRVVQVFLIHRETGLLLQSTCGEAVNNQDPDLVSAMLTAITDFVSDSFSHESQEDALNVIQFGELSLLIETGPHAIIAFAVRGTVNHEVKERLVELLENIHSQFSLPLQNFDGKIDEFELCKPLLSDALVEKEKIQDTSRPWLALTAISIISSLFLFFAYQNWQESKSISDVLAQIESEPGYQILDYKFDKQILNVNIFRSPISEQTDKFSTKIPGTQITLQINEKLAAIEDPILFLPVLQQKYQLSFNLKVTEEGTLLKASGETTRDQLEQLNNDPLIKVFSNLDFSQVNQLEPIAEQVKYRAEFKQLINEIHSEYIFFNIASAQILETSEQKLTQTVSNLKRLIDIQSKANIEILQVGVAGYADKQGGNRLNLKLSEQRASLVATILQRNNIQQDLIVSWGLGVKDNANVPSDLQRRVAIHILYQNRGAPAL